MDIVTTMFPLYLKSFTDDCLWKGDLEKKVVETSTLTDPEKRYVRMAQIFFNSPEECAKGEARLQFLTENDLDKMYPDLKDKNVPSGSAVLIIHCNGSSNGGTSGTRVANMV